MVGTLNEMKSEILSYKTLRDLSKSMSHAHRGGSSTKKVIKCDIGGEASKQSEVSHLSKNDTIKLQFIFTLRYLIDGGDDF